MAALSTQLLFCLAALVVVNGQTDGAVPMKKFTVDLDKPPAKRWLDLLSHYKSSASLIVEYFDQQVTLRKYRVLYPCPL